MVNITPHHAKEHITELIELIAASRYDPANEVTLNVTRGFQRKNERSTRDIDQTSRYSSGEEDTVVVDFALRTGDEEEPTRHDEIMFYSFNGGEPAVRLRVELNPRTGLAKGFMDAAREAKSNHNEQRRRKLIAQRDALDAQREALDAEITAFDNTP